MSLANRCRREWDCNQCLRSKCFYYEHSNISSCVQGYRDIVGNYSWLVKRGEKCREVTTNLSLDLPTNTEMYHPGLVAVVVCLVLGLLGGIVFMFRKKLSKVLRRNPTRMIEMTSIIEDGQRPRRVRRPPDYLRDFVPK